MDMFDVLMDLQERSRRIERLREQAERLTAEIFRETREYDDAACTAASYVVAAGEDKTVLIGPGESLWRVESHGRMVQWGARARTATHIHVPEPADDGPPILSVRDGDPAADVEAEACA